MTDHEQALAKLEEMQGRADAATLGPWLKHGINVDGAEVEHVTHASREVVRYRPILVSSSRSCPERGPTLEFVASVRTDAPKAYAALRAVLEMHTPHGGENLWRCWACGSEAPCPTVRAVAEKLGG